MIRTRALIGLLVVLAILFPADRPARAVTAIVLWHPWKDADAALLDSWIGAYEAASAGRVVVEANYVPFFELPDRLRLPGDGARPDVVIGPSDWAGMFVNNRLIAQLDAKLSPEYRGQLVDLAWELAHYDARIIGIPLSLEGLALYYNRALVGEAEVPATLEALLTTSERLAAEGNVGLILGKDFYLSGGIYFALGGALLGPDGDSLLTDEPAFVDYLTILRDLWARGQRAALALDAANDAFKQGRAAFIIDGNWNLPEYTAALGDALAVAPLPTVRGSAWAPLVRADLLYFLLDSPHLDAALDFAQFITGGEPQRTAAREAARVPVNREAQAAEPLIAGFAAQFNRASVPIANRPEMARCWIPLREAIDAVTVGGRAARVVARETAEKIDQAIAGLRNPPTATPGP